LGLQDAFPASADATQHEGMLCTHIRQTVGDITFDFGCWREGEALIFQDCH
jgi:hypothetical protein